MKIALVSDAWTPQVNGVVRTLTSVKRELEALGHEIHPVTPERFLTVPLPTYPDIRIALFAGLRVARMLDAIGPDAIHIATEGPLGFAARTYCRRRGLRFTTAYHTRFPEYISARLGFLKDWTYRALRRFHGASSAVMVATRSIHDDLDKRGFANLKIWSRGVDAERFRPGAKDFFDLPRPIFITVTRIAVEKNLPAFLDLDLPGSKVVVGDGPLLPELRKAYPTVHFAGMQHGEALARHYAGADVFVFPSRTDTFGLVLLEALACGLPIAAYPVPGPIDVVADTGIGCLDEDLGRAALGALGISPALCREHAMRYSWPACARQFLDNLCRLT